MIKQRLDDGDLALLEVIEDSIFCAEFMRTTRDLSPNKDTWLSKPFEYRWYQRDLITDQTEYIVLTGGRSIGKCQPAHAQVYTDKGYKTITMLLREKCFSVFCVDNDGTIQKRRAFVQYDRHTSVYKITTQAGYELYATGNHPVHTANGYVPVDDLHVGDRVSVATRLPFDSTQSLLRPSEARWLGYVFLELYTRPESGFKPRYAQIKQEVKQIASLFDLTYTEDLEGHVYLKRKRGSGKSPITILYDQFDMSFSRTASYTDPALIPRRISQTLRNECNENTKIFLEALLAQHATFNRTSIILDAKHKSCAKQLQELFLRHGIEMVFNDKGVMQTLDQRAVYRIYSEFDIPGVSVASLDLPPASFDYHSHFRYDPIVSIDFVAENRKTYAIYVYDFHNYISGNVLVHNSLVLEDKQLTNIINHDTEFPETKEMLLTTANQAQIDPVLSRVITRATTSPLLRDSLGNRVNKSLGTMDFRFPGNIQVIHRARIAGGNKESNIVGLHVPKIIIDEGQLYLLGAFTQLQPVINTWQSPKQMFIAGVSNGLRNSALYQTSIKSGKYKWYRVPAHNNPYYSREDDIDNIKKYGGIDSDDYQRLVLGMHGSAAFSVITRDQMMQKPYPVYTFSYTGADIQQGKPYQHTLDLVTIPGEYSSVVFGVDTGFVDPTIVSVFVLRSSGQWEIHARYKLTRVDFPTQETIINWLDTFYKPDKIGLDIGSGGGGTQILHSFIHRDQFLSKNYVSRVIPVQFGERVPIGYDTEGKELVSTTKTLGATLLVQMLQQHTLTLSELDQEGISQLERITRQRGIAGDERYYILSDKGNGPATDDHFFASCICFVIAIRDLTFMKKKRRKLGRASGV